MGECGNDYTREVAEFYKWWWGGVDGGSSSIGGAFYLYGSTTGGRFGNGNLGGEGLRRIIGVVVVGGWWGEYSGAAVGSIQSSPSYRRRIKGKEARR